VVRGRSARPAGVTVLSDGRRVAHLTLGPAGGRPTVYVHGALGTRVDGCPPLLDALEQAHLRLLVPSRPGYGASSPAPGRTLTSWAADLEQLVDRLDIGAFALLGVSAGGPYAILAARRLGPRVSATTIVSGTVPLWGPDAPDAGWSRRQHLARRGALPPVVRAGRGPLAALAADAPLALGPWPALDCSGAAPAVRWWHGALDTTVPLAHARAHAARIGGVHLTALEQEGHFFLRRRIHPILGDLAARAATPAPSAARVAA
jgi:pimeloyl-ACP methyl ester carboxylesterase